MTQTMTMSLRLRSELRMKLSRIEITAIQDHMYDKALNYFDPRADWQITDVLELSELAHRVRDFASNIDSTNPMKFEATRLASIIWNDFAAVYKVAMKRATPAPYGDVA